MGIGPDTPSQGSKRTLSIYNDALREKAGKEWTEAKLEALKEDVDETKKIALSAKTKAEKPHKCSHVNDIEKLSSSISAFKSLKFGALIGFLVIAAGAIGQYYALTDKTEDTEQSVKLVEESVKEIKNDVKEVSDAVDKHIEQAKKEKEKEAAGKLEELKAISDTVRAAIEESGKKRRR